MTIRERAAVALARARAAGVPASLVDTAHQRRLRAAMIRDVAALLGIAPEHVAGRPTTRSAPTAACPGS